jgi:hypothetical protein
MADHFEDMMSPRLLPHTLQFIIAGRIPCSAAQLVASTDVSPRNVNQLSKWCHRCIASAS